MIKKISVKDLFDEIFWYSVYLLPIISYLVYAFFNQDNAVNMLDYFNSNFALSPNIIQSTLQDIFGSDGIMPLFTNGGFIFAFLSYFICCMIIHLAVDVLLFIPRLCHHYMSAFEKKGGSLR